MNPTPMHPSTPRRAARAAAALTLLPGLAVAAAAPALAHDELLKAVPADGAALAEAPDAVSLTFSGDLISGQGIQSIVRVTDAAGNQWQKGDVQVSGPTLTAPLCPDLAQGEYTAAYRVVYSDGHSEEQSLDFSVTDPSAPAAGTAPSGCGVAAAGTASSTAAPASSAEQTGAEQPGAASTPAAASSIPVESGASAGVPATLWMLGAAGAAVIAVGLAVMGRKARALGRD